MHPLKILTNVGVALLIAAGSLTLDAATTTTKSVAAKKSATAKVAAPAAAKPVRVTSVEGITEYQLANGLRVLLFPDPSKQTITVNITYLVGSRNENYGETGMAHLLEHLLFKGTPRHPNVPQELTSHGARPNGSTWFDRTNYFETFKATDENLNWALDLEADRMVHSFIARKDLDSEMTVVRNEFELGENDPRSILEERVLSTAYLWHNYGKSTIGARSDIENVSIPHLQNFWRTYYQPDNAVLLVAGNIDEAKTLGLVNKYFGPTPRPTRVLDKTYTAEPTQDGERSVTLRRVGDVQEITALYHVPAAADPDGAPVQVLVEVLSDTPSGRLHKALVETKKASSISGYMQPTREPGFVAFNAEVRQDASLDDARNTMLQTIDAMTTTPATQEEVERAKTGILKNVDLVLNQSDRLGLAMSESIAAGDWRLFFLDRDRVRKVTAADVQRVAGAYLKPSNRTVGLFIPTSKPERSEIPPTPDVMAMVKDYKGEAVMAQGETFDPSPANIEARTTRSKLPSGLKIALLPKKTRGGTVVANMTLRYGDEKSLMNRSTAADLAASMLTRGTSKHTRQQIKDEFDRLKARVNVSGGPTQVNVSIETVRENLPAVMKLVAEVLRDPIFPASELDQLKQEELAQIEQQKSDPQAMASVAFGRHTTRYPKGDVRYVSTPDEDVTDVKTATLEEMKKFYSDFYGASNGELAVVGDFDPKEVSSLAADLFGNWKSPQPFTRVARQYQEVPMLNQSLEAPDKANAFFLAGMNLNLRDDDPDYPALVLGNYMLGGGFLNSRLATRIRQKEGLSYGVGSQFNASPLDKNGSFVTFAIYAPQNVTKLEAAFKEEIARALKDGFAEQEIAEAKSGYLQSRQVSRAQDGGLARTLAADLFLARTLAWDADIEKKIGALTADQITAAMRRHLDASKINIIKAGDFKKAIPAPAAPVK
ncbi:MAG TPA: pitrilysin family protein [Thermoanaerobaculia bacterium]|nr:pitrilysin family protein [Thermoanaerobaculia bacterium]